MGASTNCSRGCLAITGTSKGEKVWVATAASLVFALAREHTVSIRCLACEAHREQRRYTRRRGGGAGCSETSLLRSDILAGQCFDQLLDELLLGRHDLLGEVKELVRHFVGLGKRVNDRHLRQFREV